VFDAVSKDGYRFIIDCQYANLSVDSSGTIITPAAGDTCVVRITSEEEFILERMYTQYQRESNDGSPSLDVSNHPIFSSLLPGDKAWYSKGGAFLTLLRGGIAKIGTSSLCQMIFSRLENFARIVVRNFELLSSGVRVYSVNSNGTNTTRISLFLTDSLLPNQTSETSDFEITVKDSSLTVLTGPKDSDGLRSNACSVTLVNDGSITLAQTYDQKISQRVVLTPNHGFIHEMISSDLTQKVYSKEITKLADDTVAVVERVIGSYSLDATHLHLTGDESVTFNGKNIYSIAEEGYSTQATGTFTDVGVSA
jgi:hypothetical protein